jgi:hypothetical protein
VEFSLRRRFIATRKSWSGTVYSWQEFESSWPSKNYGVERKRFSLQRRDAISSGSGCQDEAFCQLWLSLARSTVAKSSFPIASAPAGNTWVRAQAHAGTLVDRKLRFRFDRKLRFCNIGTESLAKMWAIVTDGTVRVQLEGNLWIASQAVLPLFSGVQWVAAQDGEVLWLDSRYYSSRECA